MVTLPDAVWRTQSGVLKLVDALGGGENARFVGGAVRDGLLGLAVSDIDMGTRFDPQAVIARLEAAGIKAVPTGIAHGTVTAVSDGTVIEVTTLRRDVSTDGRHAIVAFTDDWKEDAARRDFTINALSADPETGEVFDYFGGVDDLNAGHVRFIGDAFERIAEDHLRILRFFRFFARFGRGEPDANASEACAARANDLMALSRERIAAELLKLLASADPTHAVRLMLARGILKPIVPEIAGAAADRLARLVEREKGFGVPGDPVRRLAALVGPNPAVARDIAQRLKLSKAQGKKLAVASGWEEPWLRATALAYEQGIGGATDRLLLGEGSMDDLEILDGWQRPALPISGGRLIERGLEPGPVVAKTLGEIERRWIEAGFPTGAAFDAIVTQAILPI